MPKKGENLYPTDGNANFIDERKSTKESTLKTKFRSKFGKQSLRAPRHFKSAYVCFSLVKQKEVLQQLGSNVNANDVAKEISNSWNKLSFEERAVWERVAEKDKKRYVTVKSNCKSLSGPEPARKKQKKCADRPKRPMSAYLYFAQKMRPTVKAGNPSLSGLEVTKLVGELWNNSSASERKPYFQLEGNSRAQYKAAMAEWREKNPAETTKRKSKKDSKKKETTEKENTKVEVTEEMNTNESMVEEVLSNEDAVESQSTKQLGEQVYDQSNGTDDQIICENLSTLPMHGLSSINQNSPGIVVMNTPRLLQAGVYLHPRTVPVPNGALVHPVMAPVPMNVPGIIQLGQMPYPAYLIDEAHSLQNPMGGSADSFVANGHNQE